jgi:hypothetical protein
MPVDKEIEDLVKREVLLIIEKSVRYKIDTLVDLRVSREVKEIVDAEVSRAIGKAFGNFVHNWLRKNLSSMP